MPTIPTDSTDVTTANPTVPGELLEARASIDNLDAALIHLLAERFKITQRVGRIKARENLPSADPAREARQVARLRRLAEESDLDPEFAQKVVTFIMTEVVRHHEQIRSEHPHSEDHAEIPKNVGGGR